MEDGMFIYLVVSPKYFSKVLDRCARGFLQNYPFFPRKFSVIVCTVLFLNRLYKMPLA